MEKVRRSLAVILLVLVTWGVFAVNNAAADEGPKPPPESQHSTERAPVSNGSYEGGPGATVPLGVTAYGVELFNGNLVSLDTDTPGTLNVIGAAGGAYFAGDFLNGDFSTLYAVDTDAPATLYAIDTATAAATAIGPMTPAAGQNWSGMAGDPTTGTMYAWSTQCGVANTLYTVDVATGTPTPVGTSAGNCMIDIAINAAGQMYGVDIVTDSLFSIDKATGAVTSIGPIGFDANFAQGLDFDELSGTLYHAAFNNTAFAAELRTIDLATGASTLIGPLGPGASTEVDAFSIATSSGGQVACNVGPVEFEQGIPASFTTATTNPNVAWVTTADPLCTFSNNTGGTGEAACADSDQAGSGTTLFDAQLWTNPIDLSSAVGATLDLRAAYEDLSTAAGDKFDFDVSDDGGTTWTNLLRWDEDHLTGQALSFDLTPYSGQSDVVMRFRYYDDAGTTAWDYWAQVDDIDLTCQIPEISLTATVGTTAGVCATTSEITVSPGTTVYYCYTVTNTGNVELNLHDLNDTLFGNVFTGLTYTLAPGASVNTVAAGVELSQTLNATTTNTGTWTAYNQGPTAVTTATDSTLVTVAADAVVCNEGTVTFEGGIPASFTTATTTGSVYWSTTDDLAACDNGGNQTNGTGEAACADSDETNAAGNPYDTEMWTNPLDLTNATDASMTLEAAYNDITAGGGDTLDMDVSQDGGSSWTNLVSWDEDHFNPGESVTLDLTPYVGQNDVVVRFRYYGDGWDWWAQVDDLTMDCTLVPSAVTLDGFSNGSTGMNGSWMIALGTLLMGGLVIAYRRRRLS